MLRADFATSSAPQWLTSGAEKGYSFSSDSEPSRFLGN